MARKYKRKLPEVEGFVPVAEAARVLQVTRARVWQLGTNADDGGIRLVMACPLFTRPKEGRRAYNTNWVSVDSILSYMAQDRRPGPKEMKFQTRIHKTLRDLERGQEFSFGWA